MNLKNLKTLLTEGTALLLFSELADKYIKRLEITLDSLRFSNKTRVIVHLKSLTDNTGYLSACPSDRIDVHTEPFNILKTQIGVDKEKLMIEESRFLLLQLFGEEMTRYRKYFLGQSLKLHHSKFA